MTKTRTMSSVAALALGAIVLVGCGDDGPIVESVPERVPTLVVTEQWWSGWTEDQPDPNTAEYAIRNGDELVLGEASMSATLIVDAVTDRTVTIRVADVAIDQPPGSYDLSGCGEHVLEVTVGDRVEFSTCTLDGGTSWTVSYDG